jgi:HrpA-like RNA helicase
MKDLEEQTHPEILRCNLANTVLELMALGIQVCCSPRISSIPDMNCS